MNRAWEWRGNSPKKKTMKQNKTSEERKQSVLRSETTASIVQTLQKNNLHSCFTDKQLEQPSGSDGEAAMDLKARCVGFSGSYS